MEMKSDERKQDGQDGGAIHRYHFVTRRTGVLVLP